MGTFDINQRVWIPVAGVGTLVDVEYEAALGTELVVQLDWRLEPFRALAEHVHGSTAPCPRFGVFEVEGRLIFVTPEPTPDDPRSDCNAVWARVFSKDSPAGVSAEVPTDRIMELSVEDFARAKADNWEIVPVALPSSLGGLLA